MKIQRHKDGYSVTVKIKGHEYTARLAMFYNIPEVMIYKSTHGHITRYDYSFPVYIGWDDNMNEETLRKHVIKFRAIA